MGCPWPTLRSLLRSWCSTPLRLTRVVQPKQASVRGQDLQGPGEGGGGVKHRSVDKIYKDQVREGGGRGKHRPSELGHQLQEPGGVREGGGGL